MGQGGRNPPASGPRHHPGGVGQSLHAYARSAGLRLWSQELPRLHAPQARGVYAYPRPVGARLSRDQLPNQRCRRLAANSSFSAARSADGPRNGAVGAGPDKKSASTLPTKPPPNSM
jgi:hypothetical protein